MNHDRSKGVLIGLSTTFAGSTSCEHETLLPQFTRQ
jgi:hypothetical protein